MRVKDAKWKKKIDIGCIVHDLTPLCCAIGRFISLTIGIE
jgi:hypothetical protein